MDTRTLEAIDALIQAKKMEKEALMKLIPANMKSHLDIIAGEVKAMLIEVLQESSVHTETASKAEEHKDKPTSVKKVDIS